MKSKRKSTLVKNPFIGVHVNWAIEYKKPLTGPNKNISFYPKSGIERRRCSFCFYRYFFGCKDKDCHCGENGDLAKKAFGFKGTTFLPEKINGKQVGHYCPYWTSPFAE